MASVSEIILEVLAEAGVRHLFGLPGDALNPLTEAERRQTRVRFVHVRHEENAAFAASATAKLTGGLGACMGTSGPGAIHLLNGLYDAQRDRAPVLAITGQVATSELGTNYHQEVDLHALMGPASCFNQTIVNPAQLPRLVSLAVKTALSRKGVAHLGLPFDLAGESVPHSREKHSSLPCPAESQPCGNELDKAARLLNEADKIVILAGVGALSAVDEVTQLAEKLGAPVIKTLPAKELLPDEHPLVLGGLGLLGTRPAVQAVGHCDLLLMVGTDFPYGDFYPEQAKMVQIDADPAQLGKRHAVEAGLAGHARPTLAALSEMLSRRSDRDFLERYQEAMRRWFAELDDEERDDHVPMRPQAVARAVGEAADEDAIFTCDTGAVTYWAARNLRLRGRQRFTLSSNLASMGYALPAAIAAKLAYPERQVIALVGDGGLTMGLGEFLTAVQHGLDINVVVFNNSKLGLIQMEQEVRGMPEYRAGLHNPDFGAFARICGGEGSRVERYEDLRPALKAAFSSAAPCMVDTVISGDELTVPPTIRVKQAVGFVAGKALEFLGQGDSGETITELGAASGRTEQ